MDTGKPIRVVVVDDSASDLDALCSFLKTQKRIEIVGTAKNGIELMKKVEALRPDLVITDLHLPRMSGIECTLRLRQLMPATRFIVFTDLEAPFTEADCVEPGLISISTRNTCPTGLSPQFSGCSPIELNAAPVRLAKASSANALTAMCN